MTSAQLSAPVAEVSTAASPASAPADPLRRLVRSAIHAPQPLRPGTDDDLNPVSAFLLIHPELGRFLDTRIPGIEFIVHLSQELRVHAPLDGHDDLSVHCAIREVRHDPRGSRVRVDSILVAPGGATIASSVSEILVGGVTVPPITSAPKSPPLRVVTDTLPLIRAARVSAGFSAQYALVSGDDNPIHVDQDAARAAGFAGTIAHGMSVVAIACEIASDALAEGDIGRLRALGVRFSAPVLCDSDVTVELSECATPGLFALRVHTGPALALKSAWLEIAPHVRA
ncbi:hypothetical protein GY21_01300 [Cryobacterium roopkundense]|nr:hypothetical protein GY21_01300 [Cryobacterium roopkundense]